jgi:hypothetical protein
LAHSVVQIARSESVLAIWLCGEFVGRNVQLLRERAWFDIPIVYVNQHRAILAVEKGLSGQRAFEPAFAAWTRPAGDSR